jgi:Protein of unknown function (DUF559)
LQTKGKVAPGILKKLQAMNNHDLALFQQAVNLANHGQKEVAYRRLVELANINNNHLNPQLMLWVAFTAPDIAGAENALRYAVRLAPDDPAVLSACQWLANLKAQANPAWAKEQALTRFQADFGAYCEDGVISETEWRALTAMAKQSGLDLDEALAFIQADAINFIGNTIETAAEDGFISDEEERNIYNLLILLAIPEQPATELKQKLELLKVLTKLRQGDLPVTIPRMPLPPGEVLHIEMSASDGATGSNGYLMATDKRLFYSSPLTKFGGKWQDIQNTLVYGNTLEVKLNGSAMVHSFRLQDAALFKAVLDRLIQLAVRSALSAEFKLKKQTGALKPRQSNWRTNLPQNHTPSPAEKSFIAAWDEYSASQPGKIELMPEYEVLGGRYRMDFAHPPSKTAIELDGFVAHSSAQQIANDRRREREITGLGWRFVRFGGKEINRDVYGCVAEAYRFISQRIVEVQNAPALATTEPKSAAPVLDENQALYKPERVRTLFVCESAKREVFNFYKAYNVLFARTREAFSGAHNRRWNSPFDFLSFFKKEGYFLVGLCPDDIRDMSREERQKEYENALPALVEQLVAYKPEEVIVVLPPLRPFVELALRRANVKPKSIVFEVLPFPGKGYEEAFKDKLVELVRERK